MAQFHVNQRCWFVARDNFKDHTIEYLAHEKDVFFVEGVMGYATKAEAQERADNYMGDKRHMFIQGPTYGRYRLTDDRRVSSSGSFNTMICRFNIMDKAIQQNPDKRATLTEELRQALKKFANTNGIWKFSGLSRMQQFMYLCRKYNALTNEELLRLIYDFE